MPIPAGYTSGQIVQAVPTGINSALVFITGATFTAATSFSLPNSTFTTTYQNYLIVGHYFPSATGTLSLRMRASGTDSSAASYYNASDGRSFSNNAITIANAGTTSATMSYQSDTTATLQGFSIIVFSPQIATRTSWSFTNLTAQADFGSFGNLTGGGQFIDATQFDALTLLSSAANSLTGNYKVYGLANA